MGVDESVPDREEVPEVDEDEINVRLTENKKRV